MARPEPCYRGRRSVYRVLPAVTRRFCVSLSAAVYRCAHIQPLVDNAGPLLPRRLVERLLQRISQDDDVTSVHVIGGSRNTATCSVIPRRTVPASSPPVVFLRQGYVCLRTEERQGEGQCPSRTTSNQT